MGGMTTRRLTAWRSPAPRPRRPAAVHPAVVGAVAMAVFLTSGTVFAAPPPQPAEAPPAAPAETPPRTPPATPSAALDRAAQAWQHGDWGRVQGLLGQLLEDNAGDAFDDGTELQRARILFADALLQDPELPPETAREAATEQLVAVLEADPDWDPPEAIYAPAFYETVEAARAAREQAEAENCQVERAVCVADLANEAAENTQRKLDYDELKLRYDAQEVEVVEKGVRSRALALIPFGTGHFLNDKPRLGITFATTELAFGATALALLLARNIKYQCSRPNGGIGGDSLQCRPPNGADEFTERDIRQLENIRNAETVFGALFIGTLVTDIIVSQVLFKPESTLRKRRVPRSELEKEDAEVGSSSSKDASNRGRKRRGTDDRGARLKWRPVGGATREGASLGVRLDF